MSSVFVTGLRGVQMLLHYSHLPNITNALFHTSSPLFKKKKPFRNKYIDQLHKRKQIYTGYAHEILEKQAERSLTPGDEADDTDFQEELLEEGRRRKDSYEYAKAMKQFSKGPGPRLLTWNQMEHVRFLKQTNPEEWDIRTLAHSFQVPEEVIRKVLRSKKVHMPWVREKLDGKARANQGLAQKPDSLNRSDTVTTLATPEESYSSSVQKQWGLPEWKNLGWFEGYENAQYTSPPDDEKYETKGGGGISKDGIKWLEDDECDFYDEIYREEETEYLADEDEVDHESRFFNSNEDSDDGFENHRHTNIDESDDKQHSLNVTTDGKNFYNDGELLYRI